MKPLLDSGIAMKRSGGLKIRDFTVMGERCSGTNYAQALIEGNFNLPHTRDYGWKHGFPQAMGYRPDSLIVILFRDPFDWVRSVYARPWHAVKALRDKEFPEFIRSPWLSCIDERSFLRRDIGRGLTHQPLLQDRHPLSGHPYKNLMALRRAKTIGFLSYIRRAANVVWMKYEHVAAHPQAVLADLAHTYDLTRKPEYTQPPPGLGTVFPWGSRPKPTVISAEDRRFILSQLDHDQEARIGYTLREIDT